MQGHVRWGAPQLGYTLKAQTLATLRRPNRLALPNAQEAGQRVFDRVGGAEIGFLAIVRFLTPMDAWAAHQDYCGSVIQPRRFE